jgi:hypothetical protein
MCVRWRAVLDIELALIVASLLLAAAGLVYVAFATYQYFRFERSAAEMHLPFALSAFVIHYVFGLCTTICKSVRSARISGNAHWGPLVPPTTTIAPKWAEFRARCGNDARWDR